MKRLAALTCAWLCWATPAQAQPQTAPLATVLPLLPPAALNVAVALDESARMSVPVTIGGRVWNFLIDTASTRSVIASDVADNMGLAKGKALQILNIAGFDTVPSVLIPDLGFSDLTAHDIAAPSLRRVDLGCDGLLGLDILHNSRVSIDFEHDGAMTISPSSRLPERKLRGADADAIVVVGRSRMGELIVTDAQVDGTAVAVILDTGSEDSIGNPALARLMLGHGGRKQLGPLTLLSVTGRSLPADYAVIHGMRIGDVTIANVPMAFADIATFRQFGLVRRPAILLGMQTLRAFARVTIDFPRREIRFNLRRDTFRRDNRQWAPVLAGNLPTAAVGG